MRLGCWVLAAPVWLIVLIAALPFIAVYQVVKQMHLAIRRSKLPPPPKRPPDYGLRSADGRWWWDGERWQPVR
jgi:hypothetical protein